MFRKLFARLVQYLVVFWAAVTLNFVIPLAMPGDPLKAIVGAFIACYGIARLMIMTGRTSITDGITIAVLVGVCFMLTTFGINDTFEKRPCGLTVINILYHLAGFIVAGIIIGAWH